MQSTLALPDARAALIQRYEVVVSFVTEGKGFRAQASGEFSEKWSKCHTRHPTADGKSHHLYPATAELKYTPHIKASKSY